MSAIPSRPPWFKCFPSKLLGALSAMPPDVGYVYTIILLRIYEVGGPISDKVETLARRTGLPPRRVDAALATLLETDKIVIVADHIDSVTTHEQLAFRKKLINDARNAGNASVENWRTKSTNRLNGRCHSVEQPFNDIERESKIEIESPSLRSGDSPELSTLRFESSPPIVEKQKIDNHETPKPNGRNFAEKQKSPKSVLAEVIGGELAEAIVEHRQKIHAPLTAYAAKLLAGQLAKATDPCAGARLMLERGWRGFRPDWLDAGGANRAGNNRGHDSPAGKSNGTMAAFRNFVRKHGDLEDDNDTKQRSDQGDFGDVQLLQFLR